MPTEPTCSSFDFPVPTLVPSDSSSVGSTEDSLSLMALPVEARLECIRFLPKEDRIRTDMTDPANGSVSVARLLVGDDDMAKANIAFVNSPSFFTDSSVDQTFKMSLIDDAEHPDAVRKAAITHGIDDVSLLVHTLRQIDLSFDPRLIAELIHHPDMGVVGAIVENRSIPLSADQLQCVWDRDEPFLRAMMVKVEREEFPIADEAAAPYRIEAARLPLENNARATRLGSLPEWIELQNKPDSPQIRAAHVPEYFPNGFGNFRYGSFNLEWQASIVGKPLTTGQLAIFASRTRMNDLVAAARVDVNDQGLANAAAQLPPLPLRRGFGV